MNIVDFRDIEDVFEGIWCESRQMFWFEKAWDILTKHNLTKYNDAKDETLVYIRALTLCMIYEEFCDLSFDEYCEYDSYYDKICDYVPELQIGQLYGELYNNDFTTSVNYASCLLAESERKNVIRALLKELDESMLFLGMYLTIYTPYEWLDEYDDCFINTYEEYWGEITNKSHDICNNLDDELSLISSFSWICEGTYQLRIFDDFSY